MITKTDAAERQLDTAIRLFFENRDNLSSYALAIASREVTDDLIQSRYSELYQRELARVGDPLKVRLSYREHFKDFIKPEFYKDFLKLDRKWQNFLKHADHDPGGLSRCPRLADMWYGGLAHPAEGTGATGACNGEGANSDGIPGWFPGRGELRGIPV